MRVRPLWFDIKIDWFEGGKGWWEKDFKKPLKSSADRVSNVLKFDLWGSVTVGQLVGERTLFFYDESFAVLPKVVGGRGEINQKHVSTAKIATTVMSSVHF